MHGGDSLYGRMTTTAHVYSDSRVDPELDHKAHRVTEKLSESINTIANEPSVAFYRIQEHVRKTLPQLVEQKHEVEEVQQKVQGACFDTEYAGNAVKMMQKSVVHFQNIQELLKNAMFMKQQIDYEEARRRQARPLGAGGRQEEATGSKGEEGGSDMGDSAVSTDSSLVASGHANTEADDGDCTAQTRQGTHTNARGDNQEESSDSVQTQSERTRPQADSRSQDIPEPREDVQSKEDATPKENTQQDEDTRGLVQDEDSQLQQDEENQMQDEDSRPAEEGTSAIEEDKHPTDDIQPKEHTHLESNQLGEDVLSDKISHLT